MRAFLTGVLRSRTGVALVLAVIVLGAVGIARIFGDNTPTSSWTPDALANQPTASETSRTYGPDDGVVSALPTVTPSVAKGAAAPTQVARAFSASWLERERSADAWLAALRPHCTQQLVEQLEQVDPSSVPATKVTGDLTMTTFSESAVQVTVPLDSGRLMLRLVGPNGHWFVDGVDWERL